MSFSAWMRRFHRFSLASPARNQAADRRGTRALPDIEILEDRVTPAAPIWNTYQPTDAFTLHSKPGSNLTIYMDFDGTFVSGTGWNTDFNNGNPFTIPAWSMDANRAAFSDPEKSKIIEMWRAVAEDFAPFDIDVTTQDPGLSALTFSGPGDTTWGTRAIIGPNPGTIVANSPEVWPVAGGLADQGEFKSASEIHSFIWNGDSQPNPEYDLPASVSHEVGHTLNLEHDGTISPANDYDVGHGSGVTSWGPLMGAPGGISLTQWSRDTYPSANNPEDDLAIITSAANGVSYRADDFGNTRATASALNSVGNPVYGVIEQNTDVDYFSFTANGGASVTVQVDTLSALVAAAGNLDIQARLFNSAGTLLQTVNLPALLNATINFSVPATGTYFVEVDGVGLAPENTTGYPDYGSLGNYRIAITGNTGPLVVDTTSDVDDSVYTPGNLSFREAIKLANQRAGTDAISFSNTVFGVAQTITLSSELAITDSVAITGPGANRLTVSGNNASRVFNISSGSATVAISDLAVKNGSAGGIRNVGTLTAANCFFQSNTNATDGGAIFSSGTLTVRSSTFTQNSSLLSGGAIAVTAGANVITNSTFSANTVRANGGGIIHSSPATLVMTNCTLTANVCDSDNGGPNPGFGGGIVFSGSVTLHNTIVAGNFHGTGGSASDDDVSGSLNSASKNNVIGSAATAGGLTDGVNFNLVGNGGSGVRAIATILSTSLANNGGATLTHALVQNSIAIDAGSAAAPNYTPYDQRDTARDATLPPDAGAYEVQHPLSPVGTPSTYAATFLPRPSTTVAEAFVKGLYKSTLLREGTAGEVDAWLAVIGAANAADRSNVANGFVNSVENRTNQVNFFYSYFLGRTPDPVGLAGWVATLQSGVDEGKVMSGFLLSAEFTGQNDNASFVNLMYYAILGRQADAAGFTGWKSQLDSGQLTREQVGNGFLRSVESITRVVNSDFTSYLKRVASSATLTPFVSLIQSGTTFGQVATAILATDEFFVAAGQNLT